MPPWEMRIDEVNPVPAFLCQKSCCGKACELQSGGPRNLRHPARTLSTQGFFTIAVILPAQILNLGYYGAIVPGLSTTYGLLTIGIAITNSKSRDVDRHAGCRVKVPSFTTPAIKRKINLVRALFLA